jgi:TonB-dependent starch-binding outer membrane protein SusC
MQLTALSKACHGSCSAPMDPDKRKFEKWLPVFTVTLRFLRAAKLGTQIWRIMKLITILLFTACCTASATGYSQITLSEKNAPLKKVFKKIEQQSGFHFLYPSNAVDKAGTVTIDVRNVNIEQALKAVLKGKELTYVISGETVVIKESEKQLSEQQNLPPPSIDIRGRVVNDKGEPVDGVTVTVKGTKKATFTNANGEFILNQCQWRVYFERH